jgi:hypothetical protein
MSNHPIRRSHLIAPFGVGSLAVFPDGVSVTVAGLDHWFEPGVGRDWEMFKVEEWRLQERLGVDHFRLPPDHKSSRQFQDDRPNLDLSVPGLRFPLAHSCSRCSRLDLRQPTERGTLFCRYCGRVNTRSLIYQVQFVAMCEAGHLQDFPWREWVHRSLLPECDLPLRIFSTGGASLVGVYVKCECGKKRNLRGITDMTPDAESTVLSRQMVAGAEYVCHGLRPWLGEFKGRRDHCGLPMRAALRSAANVYFADTRTAVYIPRMVGGLPLALLDILQSPPAAPFISAGRDLGAVVRASALRRRFPGLLDAFPEDGLVDDALGRLARPEVAQQKSRAPLSETQFRAFEYGELRQRRSDSQLMVRDTDIHAYEQWISEHFGEIFLVDKLRQTRVFVGFTRITPREVEPEESIQQLWRNVPSRRETWLPASVTFGEGLVLTLAKGRLDEWEARPSVQARVALLQRNLDRAVERKAAKPRQLAARFVLLHTLAHVVISRLSFESGYSAASLAERLYVSPADEGGMAGILIYTASGDADGTMGGLVRLGRPRLLEPTLRRALQRSEWCSSDPICMELGDTGGQGPNSCNLAGCHNCALIAETACEEFNRFLDRALLVGSADDPTLGFFRGYDD